MTHHPRHTSQGWDSHLALAPGFPLNLSPVAGSGEGPPRGESQASPRQIGLKLPTLPACHGGTRGCFEGGLSQQPEMVQGPAGRPLVTFDPPPLAQPGK